MNLIFDSSIARVNEFLREKACFEDGPIKISHEADQKIFLNEHLTDFSVAGFRDKRRIARLKWPVNTAT